jgi:hypothetical protein
MSSSRWRKSSGGSVCSVGWVPASVQHECACVWCLCASRAGIRAARCTRSCRSTGCTTSSCSPTTGTLVAPSSSRSVACARVLAPLLGNPACSSASQIMGCLLSLGVRVQCAGAGSAAKADEDIDPGLLGVVFCPWFASSLAIACVLTAARDKHLVRYLFHGSLPERIESIAKDGFSLKVPLLDGCLYVAKRRLVCRWLASMAPRWVLVRTSRRRAATATPTPRTAFRYPLPSTSHNPTPFLQCSHVPCLIDVMPFADDPPRPGARHAALRGLASLLTSLLSISACQ